MNGRRDLLRRILRDAPTSVLLVATNLIPLFGVVFWGWRLGTVMVLYWLENGVIGLVTVARMLLRTYAPLADVPARGAATPSGAATPATAARSPGARSRRFSARRSASGVGSFSDLGAVGFFIVHYGIFWTVHGIFVFALFGGLETTTHPGLPADQLVTTGIDLGAVTTGFIGLALYHLAAFVYWDVVRGEARRSTLQRLMFAPYPRLIVLHVTIIVGALVVAATGQPIAALVLLVLLKIAIDLGGQLIARGVADQPSTMVATRARSRRR